MSLYRLREVLDPDGSLEDALADLIDNGALGEVTGFPPEAIEAAASSVLRSMLGGSPVFNQIASNQTRTEALEYAQAALAAAWETLTGDNK